MPDPTAVLVVLPFLAEPILMNIGTGDTLCKLDCEVNSLEFLKVQNVLREFARESIL